MTKAKEERQPGQQQTDLGILSPEPVDWVIGDKLFQQMPLRIDRLSDVLEKVVDIVIGSGRGAIFDQLIDAAGGGEGKMAGVATSPALARIIVAIPKSLPKIVSLILPNVTEKFLIEHLNARVAVAIVKTFIEQNEIGALLQDFFGLMTTVNVSMKEATAEMNELAASDTEEPTEEASEPQ